MHLPSVLLTLATAVTFVPSVSAREDIPEPYNRPTAGWIPSTLRLEASELAGSRQIINYIIGEPYKQYSFWMSKIPDDVPLSSLSIPGTFDSLSYDMHAAPSTRHQNYWLFMQLQSGVRYLDIPLWYKEGKLYTPYTHFRGRTADNMDPLTDKQRRTSFFRHLTLWLRWQRDECLIVRFRPHPRQQVDAKVFAQAFASHMDPDLQDPEAELGNDLVKHVYVVTGGIDAIPILGHIRGAMLLLLDFDGAEALSHIGIPYRTSPLLGRDKHEPQVKTKYDLENKWLAVNKQLDKASVSDNRKLYITNVAGGGNATGDLSPEVVATGGSTFLSDSGVRNPDLPPPTGPRALKSSRTVPRPVVNARLRHPESFAGMNERTYRKLYGWGIKGSKKHLKTGIVVVDFPGIDLLAVIRELNFFI